TLASNDVDRVIPLYDYAAALDRNRADFWGAIESMRARLDDVNFDDLEVTVRTSEVGQTSLSVTEAALRVELYRLTHGGWPHTLAEAGGAFDDPYAAGPLTYKRLPDGVVIYSVGPNGVDDGG